MSTYQFETLEPVDLYVENGSGSVTVTADDTAETTVEITGRHADETVVRQDGRQISVIAPKLRSGFLGGDSKLDMTIKVPTDSTLAVKTGSANVTGNLKVVYDPKVLGAAPTVGKAGKVQGSWRDW